MKVLVATRETQGVREDDYCWTVEGELVRLPGLACDCPDCGCDRGMAGLSSSRATTTAKVVNREDLDPQSYGVLLCDALTREGWVSNNGMSEEEAYEWAREHLEFAAFFAEGTVVELRNDQLRARTPTADAW